MTELIKLNAPDSESFLFGENAYGKGADWKIALNGKPHPSVCPECGRIIDISGWRQNDVKIKKRKSPIMTTYDGQYIVTKEAADFIQTQCNGDQSFVNISGENDYLWWDLQLIPTVMVDPVKSKIRVSDTCNSCGGHPEVLIGLEPGSPPVVLPLHFEIQNITSGIYKTDIMFGSKHGQWNMIFLTNDVALNFAKKKYKGIHLQINIQHKAGPAPRWQPNKATQTDAFGAAGF